MTHYESAIQAQNLEDSRTLSAAVAEIMSSKHGRALYRHMVMRGEIFAPAPNPGDARTEWVGRRAFALDLFNLFQSSAPMLCEQAAQEGREIAALRSAQLEQAAALDEREKAFSLDSLSTPKQN